MNGFYSDPWDLESNNVTVPEWKVNARMTVKNERDRLLVMEVIASSLFKGQEKNALYLMGRTNACYDRDDVENDPLCRSKFDYYSSSNSFITNVISRRCGNPMLISCIFVVLAAEVGLDGKCSVCVYVYVGLLLWC